MVGTAIASFLGMLAISTIYGLAHAFIAKSLSENKPLGRIDQLVS